MLDGPGTPVEAIQKSFLNYLKPLRDKKGKMSEVGATGVAAIKKSMLPEHGVSLQDQQTVNIKNATPINTEKLGK